MALYKDDIGVAIVAELRTGNGNPSCAAVDLTGAAVVLLFAKPGGDVVEVDAEITNARRGVVRYVTVDGFLDEAGTWTYQAAVTTEDGQLWHSRTAELDVLEPLTPTA